MAIDWSIWFSLVPIVMGMLFMAKAKTQIGEAFAEADALKGQSMSGEVGGFVAHLFFMLGTVAWVWGMNNLSLCLDLEPVLAMTVAFFGLFGTLLYMYVRAAPRTHDHWKLNIPPWLVLVSLTCSSPRDRHVDAAGCLQAMVSRASPSSGDLQSRLASCECRRARTPWPAAIARCAHAAKCTKLLQTARLPAYPALPLLLPNCLVRAGLGWLRRCSQSTSS